ncbi:MAG: PAS domain-containing protein, partial [Lachnospiraceae bacterium]|nr:PAS domain-containing protein [Lachnospiraceae bacterium]
VDVLKIDMRFLDINENEEEKGIGILESVVSMARQMRMPIIVEGVETQKQESFLLKMGCRYTQGYYYYKPLPITEFERLISDERNLDLNGFWCKQTESLHLKEFFDENLFNDAMVNNILGAAAFYEMYDNRIEITRVNEQYYRLAGISFGEKDYYKKFWNHVRDDDRQVLFGIFEEAYEKPADGARGNIHFVREDGKVLWVYMRVFFLREREGRRFYYSSLTDVTSIHDNGGESNSDIQRIGDLTKEQREQLIQSYGNLPCGYCVARVLLDTVGNPADYQIVYANSAAERTIGGTTDRFRYMMRRSFGEDNQELLNKAYKAAYLGEEQDYSVYSTIASCYLRLKIYQYDYGYAGCLLQDVTNAHIQEDMMNNIMRAYREVYYIHLQDNYYRMVYPEDNLLLERGNYEESINRHFGIDKILLEDEQNIRRFLSLEHLKEALVKQNTVEYKYRRRVNEIGEEWCLTTIAVCERQNGIPKTAVMTIRSIEALMREKEGKKHQNMAQVLANMSDGFFIYRATDDEKILYANPSVLRIFGCKTMDEFRELVGNSFHGMVHPDDIERVRWEISEQVKHSDSKMDFILYRIVRKDGEIRWIDDCGHLEDSDSDNDTKLFYVFISDITDSITKQQKEKLIQQSSNYKKE